MKPWFTYTHALLSIYIYPYLHNNIYSWTLFSGNKHARKNIVQEKLSKFKFELQNKLHFFSIQTTTIHIKTQKKCTSFSNRLNQSNFNNAILNDPCKKLNYTYGCVCGTSALFYPYQLRNYLNSKLKLSLRFAHSICHTTISYLTVN